MARDIITKARLEGGEIRTKANIGNTVYGTEVHSVNGKAGHVVLNAEDVGALPSDTPIPSLDGYATEEWVGEQGYATLADIPANVSAFNNDAGYLTEHQDISGKADKATTLAGYGIENAYTKTEVDALVDGQTAPVSSVNGKTGAVTITAQELGALTEHQDISGKADRSEIPTKTSELTNDSGFLTQHQDLTPYALKSEIPVVPTNVSAFNNDAGYLTQHQDLSAYALKSEIPAEKFLFVNITQSNGAYVPDHTFAEIKQAITDGLIPILVDYKTTYSVSWHSDTAVMFEAVYGYRVWEYRIYSDGRVIYFETQLAKVGDCYTKAEIDSKIGDIETLLQGI